MKKNILMLLAMVIFGNVSAGGASIGKSTYDKVRAIMTDETMLVIQTWDGSDVSGIEYLYIDKDADGHYKSYEALLINAMNSNAMVYFYITSKTLPYIFVGQPNVASVNAKEIDNIIAYSPGL